MSKNTINTKNTNNFRKICMLKIMLWIFLRTISLSKKNNSSG